MSVVQVTEAVRALETSVYFYDNIRRHVKESLHLHVINYVWFDNDALGIPDGDQ
jgi:hypothetical protein